MRACLEGLEEGERGALRLPQPLATWEKAGARMGLSVGYPQSLRREMAEGRVLHVSSGPGESLQPVPGLVLCYGS